jgi:AhpC/TSA family protein
MRLRYILVCALASVHLCWAAGPVKVQFFISSDCPISNSYAPEIQRLCGDYGKKGVSCSLVYEDVGLDATSMRKHLNEYRYDGMPAVIDSNRKIANRAKATVTPEAVVIDTKGDIRYRGRIDNFYAALGKPRQQVTAHDLRDALDAVLAGRAVPNPETKALGCYIVPSDIWGK